MAARSPALLAADLSGMSKAETERIWLPLALLLLAACAFLTRPRGRPTAQAVVALPLNHLLATGW
ncbi:Glycosyltransferase RgtA/B/C/D-like domain-containing protein OS=Streptomyces tendae OX=1932 GN=GUR47_20360 PE=4 SV=1 [Streptomyces tendae]